MRKSKDNEPMEKAEKLVVKVEAEDNPADEAALKLAISDVLERYREAWEQLPKGKAFLVERHGEPAAVVISYQSFEAILEEIEDLQDAQAAREAFEAVRSGKETTIPWETVKANLISEGLIDE